MQDGTGATLFRARRTRRSCASRRNVAEIFLAARVGLHYSSYWASAHSQTVRREIVIHCHRSVAPQPGHVVRRLSKLPFRIRARPERIFALRFIHLLCGNEAFSIFIYGCGVFVALHGRYGWKTGNADLVIVI